MRIREPIVAGRFYPADPDHCRAQLAELLGRPTTDVKVDRRLIGGLVPHAGWVCSGAVAARVFQALAASTSPQTIVLFGAVHRALSREAALFADGRWETPVGTVAIDTRLAERILGQTNLILDDPHAHAHEHSIEVQMPLVAHLFPEATVVPIMVPPSATAHEVGEAVGRTLAAYRYEAVIVGTTDLTHYGPSYDFTPHGIGAKGNAWAKEENDKRFLELVCAMRGAEVVGEAAEYRNACGSGAVAATLGAVAKLGAVQAILLEHTTSSEGLAGLPSNEQTDSVGYAGVVFA